MFVNVPTTQGGSLYETITITSEVDIYAHHSNVVGGQRDVVVLSEHGCTHVGHIHASYCHVCYQVHYEAYDHAGAELSATLELGFSCLADAIMCLLAASDSTLTG